MFDDAFAYRTWCEQTNLAKVQVGDYLYTTTEPTWVPDQHERIVQLERPQYAAGIARKVTDHQKRPGGRWLLFEDGTSIVTRNGTAAAYRFKLDAKGKPLPTPTYPVCPTCGADEKDPACHVAGKPDSWTSTHAARKKAPVRQVTVAEAGELGQQVGERLKAKAELGLRATEHVEIRDGKVYIKDYQPISDRPVERITPKNHRIHVHPDGWVEVMPRYIKAEIPHTSRRQPTQVHNAAQPANELTPEEITDCTECNHPVSLHYQVEHEQPDGRTCRAFTCECTHQPRIEEELYTADELAERRKSNLPPTDVDDVARGPIVAPNIKPASEQQLDPDPMDGEDGADELPEGTVKCEKCKGFGVVRGKGSRAGDKYKTWSGALQAKDNGNAVECPQCNGDTIVAA